MSSGHDVLPHVTPAGEDPGTLVPEPRSGPAYWSTRRRRSSSSSAWRPKHTSHVVLSIAPPARLDERRARGPASHTSPRKRTLPIAYAATLRPPLAWAAETRETTEELSVKSQPRKTTSYTGQEGIKRDWVAVAYLLRSLDADATKAEYVGQDPPSLLVHLTCAETAFGGLVAPVSLLSDGGSFLVFLLRDGNVGTNNKPSAPRGHGGPGTGASLHTLCACRLKAAPRRGQMRALMEPRQASDHAAVCTPESGCAAGSAAVLSRRAATPGACGSRIVASYPLMYRSARRWGPDRLRADKAGKGSSNPNPRVRRQPRLMIRARSARLRCLVVATRGA
eukprot:scaffold2560_cov397-Prasinococcus_capsulatus_cf.AAC.2